jgi:hypothetical protein
MAPSKKGAPRALPKSFQFKGIPMGFAAAGFPALIAASIVLSALAPADVTLGNWVKLVYWHGMYTWACIALFTIGSLLGAWYLATRRQTLADLSKAILFLAVPLWVVDVAVGSLAAKLIWNSYNFTESRMVISLVYMMVVAVAVIAALWFDKPVVTSSLSIASTAVLWAGLWWITYGAGARDSVHPASPIAASDSIAIRVFAVLIFGLCFAGVVLAVVPVYEWLRKSAAKPAGNPGE